MGTPGRFDRQVVIMINKQQEHEHDNVKSYGFLMVPNLFPMINK